MSYFVGEKEYFKGIGKIRFEEIIKKPSRVQAL